MKLHVISIALALLMAMSSIASAGPTSQDKALAKEVMKQGAEHEKAGRLDDALAAYRIAHDIMNDPHTGASLCRVLIQSKKLVEGRTVCMAVIQMPTKSMEPSTHKKGRDEAIDLAAGLEERIGSISLSLEGLKGDAKKKVTIDGTEVEDISAPIPADPGKHRVEVSAPGYDAASGEVTVKEGQEAKLKLKLRRVGAPAEVEEDSGGLHWVFWAGVVSTGVGLIAGTATGIFVITEKNRLESECEFPTLCSPEFESELDLAVALSHVSTASFVLAGLGIGAMVGGWFLTPDEEDVGVIVHPTGVTVLGRF